VTAVFELVIAPQLLYVLGWAIPYYLLMFVFAKDYIEKCGCDTLYKYTLSSSPVLRDVVESAPSALRPLVYAIYSPKSLVVCTLI
jgi:hypothetical protein